MCELLGMSSNHQTTINISLTVLAQRGENPNLHGDGWGIAFHEGKDVRLIKDTGPAKNSQWVDFIKQQQIRSHDIIAHIRKSTIGEVCYSNTHPFTRELLGRVHSFAHNGTLKALKENEQYETIHYHPVGKTDSEFAFCVLMDRMHDLWVDDRIPSIEQRLEVVQSFADEFRKLGPLNFLYSDGNALFAHGDERHDPLTHRLSWPGLHYLHVMCEKGDQQFTEGSDRAIAIDGDHDLVTLFASVPLNEGDWRPLKRGEVLAVTRGRIFSGRK